MADIAPADATTPHEDVNETLNTLFAACDQLVNEVEAKHTTAASQQIVADLHTAAHALREVVHKHLNA